MLSTSMPWPHAAQATALTLALLAATSQAATPTEIASPNLDLSGLGRVGLAGDFDAISVYQFQGQSENAFTTNGSQALLSQLPNGMFDTIAPSDGNILTACPFVMNSGQLAGVVVGGNFTQLSGTPSSGVALWNLTDNGPVPLQGLTGSVNAVYCDKVHDRVFVGGRFTGLQSQNAIVWVGSGEWNNMPFEGFQDGSVNAIAKHPDNDNIIFAGQFSSLQNVTSNNSTMNSTLAPELVVNLGSSNISAAESTSQSGFSDPTNIVCKTSGQDGAGNTWLAQDNTRATWKVISEFGYEPTRLRLWNTHYQGRGTSKWRFTAFPINGIMNFTYIDPADGQNKTCDAECPLSNDTNVPYQDFHFVNVIGMTAFQIDMYEWYGQGAGLNGIELVQRANYVYAISDFNSPTCSNTTYPSNSTTTGNWASTPSGQSIANYLTANLTGPGVNSGSASVDFYPTIERAGIYQVNVYTPGCLPQGTCGSRGIANVTGVFTKDQGQPTQMKVYQTNNYEKFDTLYQGNVSLPDGSFRPYVRIQPLDDQNDSLSLVALRVNFELIQATDNGTTTSSSNSSSSFTVNELNGLYEFNPNTATVDSNFNDSVINRVGQNLSAHAEVTSMELVNNALYIAGNFSTGDFENIFAYSNNQTHALTQGGLNDRVATTLGWGNLLFVGGNFTNTRDGQTPLAQKVTSYDTSSNTWNPLGGGVDGPVTALVPLSLNINGQSQNCITVNGEFSKVLPGSNLNGFNTTDGMAVWVPAYNNWLQNLDTAIPAVRGQLTYAVNYTSGSDSGTLLAGTIVSQGMAIQDVVSLASTSGNATITSLGLQAPQVAASGQKARSKVVDAGSQVTLSGAVTGLFVTDNNRNMSIVGGNFQTESSNGTAINNLAFIATGSDGKNSISGIGAGVDTNSTFLAMARNGDVLFAGGAVHGQVGGQEVNGLLQWDLGSSAFAQQQPGALGPDNSHVNAISFQPSSNGSSVYVGGNFSTAGALGCVGLCVYSNGAWSAPGRGFSGVVRATMWQGNTNLLVAGNLTSGSNQTSLAVYDTQAQTWSTPNNFNQIPGPVSVVTPANSDNSQYWLAGTAQNGSAFFMKFDGNNYVPAAQQLGAGSNIRGLSVVTLTQEHDSTDLLDSHFALLVTGLLNVPNFGSPTSYGNASAALFNGSTIVPFILSNAGNAPGSMSQLFSQNAQNFQVPANHLALGFVVLIALAIALALIFLIVLAGMLLERYRRQREGYRPAPQNYVEKTANMGRIPPDQLLGNLSRGTEGPRL